MEALFDPGIWISLLTLTVLEVVLGIDNIIFIAILVERLPRAQQARARVTGLAAAMLMRLLLLFCISWLVRLTSPLFTVLGNQLSGRDLILIAGGLFLLVKSTHEIHQKLEGPEGRASARTGSSFGAVIGQVMILDVIFSVDSVITAVGMVREIGVMVAAVVIAVVFMMVFAGAVSAYIERHPTVKMLALSFLLLVGVALIADGLDRHLPRGYIYFAMGFSVLVELLNQRVHRHRQPPVRLHEPYVGGARK